MEMESKKNVIEIVKMSSNQFEYEEHYYFTGVNLEFNGTTIGMTGDVWEAAKFKDITSNEAAAWCNFLKAILGKRYEINIKTISLTYNL